MMSTDAFFFPLKFWSRGLTCLPCHNCIVFYLQIGIISGLDPAGPAFSNTDPAVLLDSTDAKYVDIIHTDTVKFGISQESRHIDFFPNGGYTQPGCDLNLFGKLSPFRSD